MTVLTRVSLLLIAVLAISGCRWLGLEAAGPALQTSDRFPDVLEVELRPTGERTFDVAVTISSPYDSPERYADGWRVLDPEGVVLGTHTLMHDHAAEQPFTRTQRGLVIPEGTLQVTVEGRDQTNGFGGAAVTMDVPE